MSAEPADGLPLPVSGLLSPVTGHPSPAFCHLSPEDGIVSSIAERIRPKPSGRRKAAPVLERVLEALRRLYGRPKAPLSEPFHLILWENVAYLADDARREDAFHTLRDRTGLSPARILAAPSADLLEVARKGILSEERVERLRAIASLVLELGGDLDEVVRLPAKEAMKALRRFPSIGEPGAEKILLFARRLPVLALESNGLRVLLRMGFGEEGTGYSATYRSAQTAASRELPEDCGVRIEAHLLLRRHGQEVCRRAAPLCDRCPVTASCAYFRAKGR